MFTKLSYFSKPLKKYDVPQYSGASLFKYICTDISLIMPTEKGVGLMDWMPYSEIPEKGVFIKNEIVFLVTEPVEGFLQQYKSLHSKIITPSQGLIT